MDGIKFADEGIVEGLGVPYGSPDRRDAQGEWFDATTDLGLDWFGERPLLYHHGIGEAGTTVIGKVTAIERRPDGLWVRAILDRAGEWFQRVRDLLEAGLLGFSSGSLPHLVKIGDNGHIDRWPLVEMSLTPRPASADARVYAVRTADALEHFAALGLQTTNLKALMADDADPAGIREQVAREYVRYQERIRAGVAAERAAFYARFLGARG